MSNEEEKIAKFKIKPQSPCKRWKTKKLGKNEYWTPNSLLSNETPSSPFFCDMFPKHIERMRENKRREKTIGETIETYKDVIELLGNKPIGDYTNIDGRYYRNSLLKTPKNRKRVKRYRDKNIHELMSLDFPPSDKMSFENQSKLISRMTSCWNFFVDEYPEYVSENVFKSSTDD